MRLSSTDARSRLASADHGVLATLHAERGADLVPVCFAVVRDLLAVPIDRVKEKGSAALGREANLREDARATLLCERWDGNDWSRLWWVRANLRSVESDDLDIARLTAGLRTKYRQYRDAPEPFERLLVFRIVRVTGWAAESAAS